MKYTALFYLMALFVAAGCSKTSPNEVKDGVAVETIEATANFDLTARKDWLVYVGTQRYHYQTEGNKLLIIGPVDKPFIFPYDTTEGVAEVQMISPHYGKARSESKIPFVIENQSTAGKFMEADRMRFAYRGKPTANISGLSIRHFNALLTFRMANLPQNAKVYIEQAYNQTITPWLENPETNSYKAIVFPENKQVTLVIETAGKTHHLPIPPPPSVRMPAVVMGIGSNTVISFDIEMDEDNQPVLLNYTKDASIPWPINK